MKKCVKFKVRLISLLTVIVFFFGGGITKTVFAAGVETWDSGYVYNVGEFIFSNTNTTPTKTINGKNLSIIIGWKKSTIDKGIGDVKLTIQILDALTGNAITGKNIYYFQDDGSGYSWLSLNITNLEYGQKIKIWFDASSVDPNSSNGKYRSIEIGTFSALVDSY